MIVAAVALFAALGGGAYAGVAVNQVESIHIKNGEVRSVDLADGAVGGLKLAGNSISSPKVRNGGLEAEDLSAAARTSLRGQAFHFGTETLLFWDGLGVAQEVATLSLPAGDYMVQGHVLFDNDGDDVLVDCELRLGRRTIDSPASDQLRLEDDTGTDRAFYAVSGVGTLRAPGTAKIMCVTPRDDGEYLKRNLDAIQVGALG